jgi:tyrosinase
MTDLNTAINKGLVTGLPGFGIVPRQDIDVLLLKEPDSFNLFVLALRELQAEKAGQPPQWQDKMSFYQLAGEFAPG